MVRLTQVLLCFKSSSTDSNDGTRRTMAIRMSAIDNDGSLHSSYSEYRAQSVIHHFPNVTHVPTHSTCQPSSPRCVRKYSFLLRISSADNENSENSQLSLPADYQIHSSSNKIFGVASNNNLSLDILKTTHSLGCF